MAHVRHLVLLKFKEGVDREAAARDISAALANLPAQIPFLNLSSVLILALILRETTTTRSWPTSRTRQPSTSMRRTPRMSRPSPRQLSPCSRRAAALLRSFPSQSNKFVKYQREHDNSTVHTLVRPTAHVAGHTRERQHTRNHRIDMHTHTPGLQRIILVSSRGPRNMQGRGSEFWAAAHE